MADVLTAHNDNHRSGDVLRLDGGDGRSDTKSTNNVKKTLDNRDVENDKFTETIRSINGNNEHHKAVNLKNGSSSFIDIEKQNGNKMISEKDIETIDRNSNRYTVT